jgi:hypothetical protein
MTVPNQRLTIESVRGMLATEQFKMLYLPFLSKKKHRDYSIRNCVFVVLCGCETLSLILKGEQRLRIFQERVLR